MKKQLKIYLASSFRFTEQVTHIRSKLQLLGHMITCEWWHTDYKQLFTQDQFWNQEIIKVIYQRTLEAIKECDILILVSPEPTKFNGANVEVGIALALGKPVVAYGLIEVSGMYAPVVRCDSLKQLELFLKEYSI